ncbi:dimethyladenosine transferase [Mycobacterium sp. CBMA271]|uniref:SRPBCC family protein n=1 Tax=unclassified Mycobacteroides TaxID=2618759 RepID=UPI0012DBF566|nr:MULTISPECIES: SRPBCC family protein [unclassified Mycobacteroides]MUM22926.1 dimethyladenosine transferase [Mycobacteroides sp. CBMA 271]
MTQNMDRQVIVERVIDANAQHIFDVLADPASHTAIDGTGALRDPLIDAPGRLYLGAKFTMGMRTRLPDLSPASVVQVLVALTHRGRLTNVVKEFNEGRLISWRNFGRHIWRYELEPLTDERTLVRETFDYSTNIAPWLLELARFPTVNRRAMRETLDRLANAVS